MRSARPGRRLLAVAVVIAVALAGAGAALAWEGYRDARAAELEEVADGARASAADVSQLLGGREQLLQALAGYEGIVREDDAAVSRRLAALELVDLGFTAGIAWVDATGRVRASSGARGPSPVTEPRLAAVLTRARERATPFVSEALAPSVFTSRAIVIAVPTQDGDGRVNGVLAAAIGLDWLNGVSSSLREVRGGRTFIVDRAGQLIVEPGFAGVRPVGDDPLVRRARAQRGGPGPIAGGSTDDARTFDGRADQALGFAYEPRRTGWALLVGRDADDAFGGALRQLRLQLGGLTLLVLVGVGGAALVARRLDRLAGHRDELLESTRRAEGRSAFLARAAGAIGEVPRVDDRLRRLAQICVPELCDLCVVELPPSGDEPARRSVAGVASVASDDDVIRVPLVIGEVAVGSIELSRTSARPFEPADVEFAESLAAQASVQLESARLYEREHEIARVLQRSLLPDALPAVAGVELAARYLAAGEALEAGGDWYEAVPLGEGRVALAVGDVVGKGSRAAAAMGQLRSAMRAFAIDGRGPADLLTRLSRFAETSPDARCATVACAVVDAVGGEVRYACAGHPPPLVVDAGGTARYLEDGRGGPLAGWADVRFTEGRDHLDEGDLMALYSDGLVERRRESIDAGLERLAAAAGALADAGVGEVCDGLLTALGAQGAPDDVALLVVRRTGLPVASRPVGDGEAWAGRTT